jgi:hypothetical protein
MPDDYENSVKNIGDLLDAANRPLVGESLKTELDFTAGDFSFFKPYDFGQFHNSEILKSNTIKVPSSSIYTNESANVQVISKIDISCSAMDLSFVDFSGCNPSDPSFLSLWKATGDYNTITKTPNPTSLPPVRGIEGISNATEMARQCFRSHYCANSLMSKSLQMMDQYSSGMEKRFQDLEDSYFHVCLQIFNYVLAIVVFIGIIIYQNIYTKSVISSNPTQ